MSIIIASIILTLIAAVYAILLKRKLAETYFLAVVTVVGVLYCFGLINVAGCLLFGVYTLVVLALCCTIFLIYYFLKKRNYVLGIEALQGCLLYFCLLLFSLFINYGKVLHSWDEFSHWGVIVKYFYSADALGTYNGINNGLAFPTYFPGISLFLYFFSRFSSHFIEYHLYIAMNAIYFTLLMPFVKDIFRKTESIYQFLLLITFLILPFLGYNIDGGFYASLMVDLILGGFFGFTLLYYFSFKYEKSLYGILIVSAGIFMLAITKDIGILFSLGIIAIIILDIILFRRIQIKDILLGNNKPIQKISKIIILLLPFLATLFIKITWSKLLLRSKLNSYWHIPTLSDIFLIFSKQIKPYQKETARNFINAMWQRKVPNINMNVIIFSILFIVILLFFIFINKKRYSVYQILILSIMIIAGLFLYQFILMVLYIFDFAEIEAVSLASYERYTSTYLVAMMIFTMLFFIPDENKMQKNSIKSMIQKLRNKIISDDIVKYGDILKFGKLFFLLSVNLALFLFILINSRNEIRNTLLARQIYPKFYEIRPTAIAANNWKSFFNDTNPYLIAQGDKGLIGWLISYEFCPNMKLGNKKWGDYNIAPIKNDYWTLAVSADEWEKYVLSNKFKIVWVYKSNDELKNTYGCFFPNGIEDDMLYHVKDSDGHMMLIPVTQNGIFNTIAEIPMPNDIEILKQQVYDINSIKIMNTNLILSCGNYDPQINLPLGNIIKKPSGIQFLKITYTNTKAGILQIFYNYGHGLSEENSSKLDILETNDKKTVIFPITGWYEGMKLNSIRIDPPNDAEFQIINITINQLEPMNE